VECSACRLLYVNPQPTSAELLQHYRVDSHWGGEPQQATEQLSKYLYSQILGLLPQGGEVLDVGCSFGVFLNQLRQSGRLPTGIELSSNAAEVARKQGFTVHSEPIGPYLEEARFRSVTLLNVIEHVHSPLEVCRQILRILEPGGMVAMATPNTSVPLPVIDAYLRISGGRELGRFPRAISQIHPPNHLYFYTPATFKDLLEKAGFCDVRIQNAAPILNKGITRTLAKIGLYSVAEIASRFTAGRVTLGHSLLASASKRK
jgi:SAM-dependent methyltransferase